MSCDTSLFDRINAGYDALLDDWMIDHVHKKFVHPLIPLSKSLVDQHCKAKSERTLHSAFMTAPSVLNVSNWMNHVLNHANSFRVSFKYNGIRVWLLLSSFASNSETEQMEHALGIYSHTLPSGKKSISALLDRSGKVWLLDPITIKACHRLWEYSTLLEGELCPSPEKTSTLVLFDCISVANAKILSRSNLDIRSGALHRMAPFIQISQVRVIAKTWWHIGPFFQNDLSALENQLSSGFETATGLSIDGLIVAHHKLLVLDNTTRQVGNLNKIFKYKPRQTVDLWVSDVGTCAPQDRRYLYIHTFDDTPSRQEADDEASANLAKFKIVRASRNGGTIEYSPEDDQEQYLYSPWQYRYDIKTPYDRAAFANDGIHSPSVDIWLCVKSDDLYPATNAEGSAMRQWLMQRGASVDTSESPHRMTRPVLVEFGISMEYKTPDMIIFNLAPIQLRRDKPYANSARVVAETCVASLYENFAHHQQGGGGGGGGDELVTSGQNSRPGICLTPAVIFSSLAFIGHSSTSP